MQFTFSYINLSIMIAVTLTALFGWFTYSAYGSGQLGLSRDTTTLSTGLVGYWSMDGSTINWTANTIADLSGQGNTGSLVSMSTTTSPVLGKIGQALNFNGTSQEITVPAQTLSGTFTQSFWWNTPNDGNTRMVVANSVGGSVQKIGMQGSNFFIRVISGGSNDVTVALPLKNTWHLVVVTRDSASIVRLSVDGQARSTLFSGAAQSGNYVVSTIGFASLGDGQYFLGAIDDVRVYNRALSAQEVQQLYKLGAANIAHSPSTSSGQATAPLSAGLVGYWSMDGSSINWTTNKMSDLSGQENTGTLVSMSEITSPVIGKIGQALKFDGTNNDIDVGNNSALEFTSGGFSVSSWTYLTTTAPIQLFVFHGLGCVNYASWLISIGGTEDGGFDGKYFFGFRTINNSPSMHVASVGNATTGKWVHLVGVYDGSSLLSLYVNGVLSNTAAASGNPFASPDHLYLGGDSGCSIRDVVHGNLDDVRIYNRAISAQEVAQLYALGTANVAHSPSTNSGQTTAPLSAGLVGYWSMDGSSINWTTNKMSDLSGQGNTGSLVSMSTTTSPVIGKIGQALQFDGATTIVTVPTPVNLDIGLGSMTWSTWFRTNTVASSIFLYRKSGSSDTGGAWIRMVAPGGATGKLECIVSASLITVTTTNTYNDNKWHNVNCVLDRSNNILNLYMDGKFVTSADASAIAGASQSSTNAACIGSTVSSATACAASSVFQGVLDDFRIYNRALSAQDVSQLYAMGR